MRAPSLYKDISRELKIIAKEVLVEENNYIDHTWLDIKEQIQDLARQCQDIAKERRERGDD